jgi:hypothetical protein
LHRISAFFPEPVRGWHDLSQIAYELSPVTGIECVFYEQAVGNMGVKHATAKILHFLKNLASFDNPAGYLKRPGQHTASGYFCASGLFGYYSH